ncbi:ABC transporter permease [Halobacterium salinarum]|uniref:ABC transporter permease n=1 Tax=Halobacterium salinarum TaxID=2242 RepID=UPI001F3BBA92|nr:ABC transporter permease [Halobacterium salinarum]MCF2164359.1 ABC transporter permease [Halobacterium salinarum]MCF2167146.1 ABC transporter permease [Halobacterium salinarum]MCF2207795.1 ABC transporter permease [Halobacterium salinarum]
MKWYIVKRVLWTFVVMWIALTLTFGLLVASPDTGQTKSVMSCSASGGDAQQCREQYRERQNLDKPITERYVNYVTNMATLNWGWSESRSQSVMAAISEAWPYTAQYAIPVLVVSTILGYGLGLYSAYKPYTKADYLGSFVGFFGISIPNFWFALVLIILLGTHFEFVSTYYQSGIPINQGWASMANITQLLIPSFVLLTASLAWQMRYSRAQAIEQMNQEFVKVAKAKGASQWRLMIHHVFRMAAVPLTTSFVSSLLAIFWSGSVIIEQIFSIPGLGLMTFTAITEQDTTLVLATTMITVFLAIIGNLIEDVSYTILDPRIDYGDR